MKKGFTLIETITYLGLLSVILAIVLPAFYFISNSMDREKISFLESEESDFISAKIGRLISESSEILEPLPDQIGGVLKLQLNNSTPSEVIIGLENGGAFVQKGSGTIKENISSMRVTVSDLKFIHLKESIYARASISFSFKIDSRSISTSTSEISRHEL